MLSYLQDRSIIKSLEVGLRPLSQQSRVRNCVCVWCHWALVPLAALQQLQLALARAAVANGLPP